MKNISLFAVFFLLHHYVDAARVRGHQRHRTLSDPDLLDIIRNRVELPNFFQPLSPEKRNAINAAGLTWKAGPNFQDKPGFNAKHVCRNAIR